MAIQEEDEADDNDGNRKGKATIMEKKKK